MSSKSRALTTPAYTKDLDKYRLAKLWRGRSGGGGSGDGIIVACSDETSPLTTGLKRTFYLPYSVVIDEVIIDVVTAPTGASLIVDVDIEATSIFTTKPEIQVSEFSSLTGVSSVLSVAAHSKGDKVEIYVDQIGSTVAGAGLKVAILWSRV